MIYDSWFLWLMISGLWSMISMVNDHWFMIPMVYDLSGLWSLWFRELKDEFINLETPLLDLSNMYGTSGNKIQIVSEQNGKTFKKKSFGEHKLLIIWSYNQKDPELIDS